MAPAAPSPAPPETAPATRPAGGRRSPLRATVTDDSRRHAVIAVQRALDRRDNGGAFGH